MKYRREIDGLRAIAVLPVIFFHAGFEIFKGGFIGVDVFFVISGYLITTIILSDLENNKFSIINFYEKRARRILPALFFVIIICIILSFILFMPSDMKDFSKSLIAVSTFSSNILFLNESGYFDTASELKPLLHTWSLAVEEQFYLLFPIFLLLFWKIGRHRILVLLLLIWLSSFIYANLTVRTEPTDAFYLLTARGWELISGAFAAFYLSRKNKNQLNKEVANILGWVGISLIIVSIFIYSTKTPFPSIYTLAPILGSLLIIIYANDNNSIGKFIGNKIFVGIGLISYSAYIWHQPLFSFARYMGFGDYDKEIFAALSFASISLAYFSWKYIETPFRNKSIVSTNSIFLIALFASLSFISLGFYGYKEDGYAGRLNIEKTSFLQNFENSAPNWSYFHKADHFKKYREDCNFYDIKKMLLGSPTHVPVDSISESCFTKNHNKLKTIFIWGDSHAQQLNYGLSETLPKEFEVLQVASSACRANLEAKENKDNYCEYSNWFALDQIQKIKPEFVIIGQHSGHEFDNMKKIQNKLKATGVKHVIFTGPVPNWTPNLPTIIARSLPSPPSRTFAGLDKRSFKVDQKIIKKIQRGEGLNYLSLIDYFCNKDGCITYYNEDIAESITTHDYGHLSSIASFNLAKDVITPKILSID